MSLHMAKYTPELGRELILTAERNKDWEGNAFGICLGRQDRRTLRNSKEVLMKKTAQAEYNDLPARLAVVV